MSIEIKENLTDFQKSICEPYSFNKEDINHPGNNMHSEYSKDYRKTMWSFHKSQNMKCVDGIYETDTSAYGLLYTDLYQEIPFVKCKNGYKARWPPNLMSNFFKSGKIFTIEDGKQKVIQSISNFYVEGFNQTMIEPHLYEDIQINNGNIKSLQEWKPFLPQETCSLKIPWLYSEDFSLYFPLHLLKGKLYHHIEFDELTDLLLIKNGDRSVKFPEGIDEIGNIKSPELWAEYLQKSSLHKMYENCRIKDLQDLNLDNRTIYNDIITYSYSSDQIEDIIKIPIDIIWPITCIIWTLEGGIIDKTSLYVQKETIFENLPSHRTNRTIPERHLKCIPRHKKFNYWVSGGKYNPLNPQPGIMMKGGSLIISPMKSDSFSVKVCFIITKKIKFSEGNVIIE